MRASGAGCGERGEGYPTGACVRLRPGASGQGDQDSECLFTVGRVMSLKAGGFGLNLTAADYVLIVDP